jgi:hypothetical protein
MVETCSRTCPVTGFDINGVEYFSFIRIHLILIKF